MSEAEVERTRRWQVPALVGAAVLVCLIAAAVVLADGDDTDPTEPSEQASAETSACEIRIFLDRGVTADQRAALAAEIEALPDVDSFRYLDQEATVAEAETLFADNEEMLDRVRSEPDILPTSFRIVPATGDTDALQSMTDTLSGQDGVLRAAWGLIDRPKLSGEMTSRPGEVIVFLAQDVTDDQRAAVDDAVAAHPDVADYDYLDQAESLAEFERLFRNNQEMLDRAHANPERIPTSFRITPKRDNPETLEALASEFGALPGVRRANSTAAMWDSAQDAVAALGVC